MDLATAYKACARITRREARNFYFAFLSLPKPQRQAVYALYAFCREADDAADSKLEALSPSSNLGHGEIAGGVTNRDGVAGRMSVSDSEVQHPRDEKCGGTAFLVGSDLSSKAESANSEALSPSSNLGHGEIAGGVTNRDGVAGRMSVSDSEVQHPRDEKCGETAFLDGSKAENDGDTAGLSREDAEREGKRAGLARLRERLWKAAKGEPETLIDVALADAIDRFGVDPQDLSDVITGVEMDLDEVSIGTFEELRTYCYHVASAVGLATLPILNDGIPPTDAMRESAIDLGLGMQFANVLRDVAEDLDSDRIYLPAEERERFGVTDEAFRARRMTKELRMLFSFEYERAKRMLADGRTLIPFVPRAGRGCLWLLSEMYGRILERIADAEFDVYAGRVSLPTSEKLGLLASTFWRRL